MKYRPFASIEAWSGKFWLISNIAFLVLSCSIASIIVGYDYVYELLEPCRWLDTYLERSNCIQVLTYTYYEGRVTNMSFSPDGQTIAAGGIGESAKIWAIHTGKLLHELDGWTTGIPEVIAFAPDGKTVALGEIFYEDSSVLLINLETGDLFFKREGLSGYLFDLVFSPDGAILAAATGREGSNVISLWRVSDGQLLRSFVPDHGKFVTDLTFSPDGERLSAVYYRIEEKTGIYTWQVNDNTLLNHSIFDINKPLILSPSGNILASGSCILEENFDCVKAKVERWRVADGQLLHKLDVPADHDISLAFSPDETLLASSVKGANIQLWRVHDGTLLHTFRNPEGWVGALAFSPDGKILAVGGADIILWRIK